ncbi:hypothetical protein [Brevibacterium sediminis]
MMVPQQSVGGLPPVILTPEELNGVTVRLRVGEMLVVPTDLTLAAQTDPLGIVVFEPGRSHGSYTTNPGFIAVGLGTTAVRLSGSGGESVVRFSVIVRRDDPDDQPAGAPVVGTSPPAPKPGHGDSTSGSGDSQ